MLLATWGITVVGTAFSAVTVNVRLRELMLPVLLYPILIPLLIGAMEHDHRPAERRSHRGDHQRYRCNCSSASTSSTPSLGALPDRLYSGSLGGQLCAKRLIYTLGVLGTLLMIVNLHTIFLNLPDEAHAGRDLPHHLHPRARGDHADHLLLRRRCCASIAFLVRKSFLCDSIAVSAVEVGTMFIAGEPGDRQHLGPDQWGIWWAWDVRMTTQLMCFLLYLGYLLMRPADHRAHTARHHVGYSRHLCVRRHSDRPDGHPAPQRADAASRTRARNRRTRPRFTGRRS